MKAYIPPSEIGIAFVLFHLGSILPVTALRYLVKTQRFISLKLLWTDYFFLVLSQCITIYKKQYLIKSQMLIEKVSILLQQTRIVDLWKMNLNFQLVISNCFQKSFCDCHKKTTPRLIAALSSLCVDFVVISASHSTEEEIWGSKPGLLVFYPVT